MFHGRKKDIKAFAACLKRFRPPGSRIAEHNSWYWHGAERLLNDHTSPRRLASSCAWDRPAHHQTPYRHGRCIRSSLRHKPQTIDKPPCDRHSKTESARLKSSIEGGTVLPLSFCAPLWLPSLVQWLHQWSAVALRLWPRLDGVIQFAVECPKFAFPQTYTGSCIWLQSVTGSRNRVATAPLWPIRSPRLS